MGIKDKLFTRRYAAVYIIASLTAIVVYLIGVNSENEALKNFLLNISSELFAVTFMVILVSLFLLRKEWDAAKNADEAIDAVVERMENILWRMETTSGRMENLGFLGEPDPNEDALISARLKNGKLVQLLGQTLRPFLTKFYDDLAIAIRNGATLQVILIDHEKCARDLIEKICETQHFAGDVLVSHGILQRLAEQARAIGNGSVEVRLVDWIPSCSVIIIDPSKTRLDAFVKVTVNALHFTALRDRLHIVLSHSGQMAEKWCSEFATQFNLLWAKSRTVISSKDTP